MIYKYLFLVTYILHEGNAQYYRPDSNEVRKLLEQIRAESYRRLGLLMSRDVGFLA